VPVSYVRIHEGICAWFDHSSGNEIWLTGVPGAPGTPYLWAARQMLLHPCMCGAALRDGCGSRHQAHFVHAATEDVTSQGGAEAAAPWRCRVMWQQPSCSRSKQLHPPDALLYLRPDMTSPRCGNTQLQPCSTHAGGNGWSSGAVLWQTHTQQQNRCSLTRRRPAGRRLPAALQCRAAPRCQARLRWRSTSQQACAIQDWRPWLATGMCFINENFL
jgi:hypothetical protein